MSEETLVQLRLQNGRYDGIMTAAEEPEIEVLHAGSVIAMASVTPDPDRRGAFRVGVDIPTQVLSEGVQMLTLRSRGSGDVLTRITFMSGEVLDEDIRAEIVLLREELEMLKAAFRRHCSDTGQD